MVKRCYLLVVVLICALLMSTSKVLAADSTYGHRMIGGISNVYVYIDDKEPLKATYWQNLIKAAIDNWMYTGVGANQFYCLGYVSGYKTGSKLDFFSRDYDYFGKDMYRNLAETSWWNTDIQYVNSYTTDWYSARIDINDSLLRRDTYTNEDAIGVFVHEIGHGFGLDHRNDKNSIMYPAIKECNVRRVQKIDNDTLNSLY